MKLLKLLLGVTGALIIVVLLGLGYFYYLFYIKGFCDKTTVADVRSPSGNYVVQMQLVECGAVSADATQFRLRNLQANTESNILSIKEDHTKDCEMIWESDSVLNLRCRGPVNTVYNQKNRFEGVSISFLVDGTVNHENIVN